MRISDWGSDVCSSDLRRGLCRHVAFGMEIRVEGPARFAPVDQLDTSDFDQPVAGPGVESRRLCIEDYLPHSIRQSGPYRAQDLAVMAQLGRCASLFRRQLGGA